MKFADSIYEALMARDPNKVFDIINSPLSDEDAVLAETIKNFQAHKSEFEVISPSGADVYVLIGLYFREIFQDSRAEDLFKLATELGEIQALVEVLPYELGRGEVQEALKHFDLLVHGAKAESIRAASDILYEAGLKEPAHHGYHVAYSRGNSLALSDLMFKFNEYPEGDCPEWTAR